MNCTRCGCELKQTTALCPKCGAEVQALSVFKQKLRRLFLHVKCTILTLLSYFITLIFIIAVFTAFAIATSNSDTIELSKWCAPISLIVPIVVAALTSKRYWFKHTTHKSQLSGKATQFISVTSRKANEPIPDNAIPQLIVEEQNEINNNSDTLTLDNAMIKLTVEEQNEINNNSDNLLLLAIKTILEVGQVSTSLLQRRVKVGFARAARMIDEMELMGIVGPFNGDQPRQIVINSTEQLATALKNYAASFNASNPTGSSVLNTKITMQIVDNMVGIDFEKFVACILKMLNYENVEVTQASGDQGVDILAQKGGIKYAIQCKNYSSPVGNGPVQEVLAGKDFYHCHVGVVVTNSTFTKGAVELAEKTNIILWDRNDLSMLIEEALPNN